VDGRPYDAKAVVRTLVEAAFGHGDLACLSELAVPEAAESVRRSLEECRRVAGPATASLAIERIVAGDGLVVCHCTWPPGRTSPLVFRVSGGRVTECWHRWEPVGDGVASRRQEEASDPRLAVDEIQAHVLAGFAAPYQAALFLELTSLPATRRWLRRVAGNVTPLAAAPHGGRPARAGLAAAFTFEGLRKLAGDAERFREMAFKEGLHRRSPLLGDPRDDRLDGHPRNWVVGGPGRVPDVFLLVAASRPSELAAAVARVVPGPGDGARLTFSQEAAALRGPHGPREHFGFRDPVSQPGVRGLTSRSDPADPHHGRPGQRLVWPGEFVFGYPGQNAIDLVQPGPVTAAGPDWAVDGSYLVVRRLRQDVAAFRRFVAAAAARTGVTPERFAATCFGRWPSGAPLVLSPERDDPALGADEARNDDFGFAADAAGLVCPQAAHIRKAYLRDHPTTDVAAAGVEIHRLLRRSIPYGPPYPRPGDRGLLFLAYQTSLERQFEFVTRAWLNNPCLRDGEDGHDPVVGQNGRYPHRKRRFTVPLRTREDGVSAVVLTLDEEWVVPTGGGYFFAPSLGALRLLAS
jgi:Dyp-type peroxidase family